MEESIKESIRLGKLAGEYLSNENPEKPSELTEWQSKSEDNQQLFNEMASDRFALKSYKFHSGINPEQEYELFMKRRNKQTIRRILKFSIPAAAAILIGIGIWYFPKEQPTLPIVRNNTEQNTILPGKHKAILITSNNEEINLGEQQENINDGSIVANSSESGLSYKTDHQYSNQKEVPRHRLIVPAGGEYQLVLADGTKVWINAKSELSYPVAFTGNKREVFLKGEAYFEVTHNDTKPFYVRTNHLNVGVTGTSFNVTAYPEEAENHITLVEGSVNVLKDEKIIASLIPGKQLDYNHQTEKFKIIDSDIESITAWKKGFFLFKEEQLSSIVNKLERWYNVDFKFSTPAEDKRYSGYIRRDSPIDSTLNILRLTNEIDFKIGKTNDIEITAIQ